MLLGEEVTFETSDFPLLLTSAPLFSLDPELELDLALDFPCVLSTTFPLDFLVTSGFASFVAFTSGVGLVSLVAFPFCAGSEVRETEGRTSDETVGEGVDLALLSFLDFSLFAVEVELLELPPAKLGTVDERRERVRMNISVKILPDRLTRSSLF